MGDKSVNKQPIQREKDEKDDEEEIKRCKRSKTSSIQASPAVPRRTWFVVIDTEFLGVKDLENKVLAREGSPGSHVRELGMCWWALDSETVIRDTTYFWSDLPLSKKQHFYPCEHFGVPRDPSTVFYQQQNIKEENIRKVSEFKQILHEKLESKGDDAVVVVYKGGMEGEWVPAYFKNKGFLSNIGIKNDDLQACPSTSVLRNEFSRGHLPCPCHEAAKTEIHCAQEDADLYMEWWRRQMAPVLATKR